MVQDGESSCVIQDHEPVEWPVEPRPEFILHQAGTGLVRGRNDKRVEFLRFCKCLNSPYYNLDFAWPKAAEIFKESDIGWVARQAAEIFPLFRLRFFTGIEINIKAICYL